VHHARDHEDDTFTQIVQFEVDRGQQEPLIAAVVAEVERWVRHRPGFLSSTFHASFDGQHVLKYAQWRTKADFDGFTKDPEGQRLSAAIHAVGPHNGHAIAYRVVRAIDRPEKGASS